MRRIDGDGHLFIEVSPISKANVCGYRDGETPDHETLGLDPARIHQLLRAPAELEKAASSFRGKPVLSVHRPVTADDHPHKIVVGSIGQDVRSGHSARRAAGGMGGRGTAAGGQGQSLRAVQLSLHHGKRDVLGLWLSLTPFGGNLVGVEAASRAYFGKPAAALDPAEAALLVALPRRPEALRDRILAQAAREGLLTAAEAQAAMAEPVPTRRRPMPGTARTDGLRRCACWSQPRRRRARPCFPPPPRAAWPAF